MKKIISICALTALSFTLIGCTSTSATDKASQVKQEHTQHTFQLNSANISDIEILKQQIILLPNLKQITKK